MFTGISSDDPFLISDIGILYPLSFLVNMEDLINFIELFKEPAFDFFDFLCYFAAFLFIDFHSDFYYFLFNACLNLNCSSFSSFLWCKPKLEIIDLFSFLIYTFNTINVLQALFSLYQTNFEKLSFHICLVQKIFKFLLRLFLWPICYLVVCF